MLPKPSITMSTLQRYLSLGKTGPMSDHPIAAQVAPRQFDQRILGGDMELDSNDEDNDQPMEYITICCPEKRKGRKSSNDSDDAYSSDSAGKGKRRRVDKESPKGNDMPEFIPLGQGQPRVQSEDIIISPMTPAASTAKPWAHSPWQCRSNYSLNKAVALHQEIEDFVKFIRPTRAEIYMRNDLIRRISVVCKKMWPKSKVQVFGSVPAGIFLPTSDIDLVVQGKWRVLPLRTLANALQAAKIPSKLEVIDKARVPIIKLKDAATSLSVDISFNMTGGPEEADRIRQDLEKYPALYPLTLIIKQFLAQRHLNEVYTGGLGSYAVSLLVLSFLQLHPRQNLKPNLGVLLIEFFELYGKNFNYEKCVISVRNGGRYLKKGSKWVVQRRPRHLAIENPRSPDDDVSRGSFAMDNIKYGFIHAFAVLSSTFAENRPSQRSMASILGQVVKLPQEVVDFREWVERTYGPLCADADSGNAVAAALPASAAGPPTAAHVSRELEGASRELEGGAEQCEAVAAVHRWANSKVRRLSSKLLDGDDVDVSEINGYTPADPRSASHSKRETFASTNTRQHEPPAPKNDTRKAKRKHKKKFIVGSTAKTPPSTLRADQKRLSRWKNSGKTKDGGGGGNRIVSITGSSKDSSVAYPRGLGGGHSGGRGNGGRGQGRGNGGRGRGTAGQKRSSGKASNKKTTSQRAKNGNPSQSKKRKKSGKKTTGANRQKHIQ